MHLWLDYIGKSGKKGQQRVEKGLKGHACYAWKQVWMWEEWPNEAVDVYSRVMMSTNGP